ncbi:hypothetical protein Pfo_011030 [Paulownia fortunei]|nr:hypothetical protein Pfo_011030 [Paulownia fortunei]
MRSGAFTPAQGSSITKWSKEIEPLCTRIYKVLYPLLIEERKGLSPVSKIKAIVVAAGCFQLCVAVEGINHFRTNNLVSPSEQELVDCENEQNQGCNGGVMDLAFDFIRKKGSITTEKTILAQLKMEIVMPKRQTRFTRNHNSDQACYQIAFMHNSDQACYQIAFMPA